MISKSIVLSSISSSNLRGKSQSARIICEVIFEKSSFMMMKNTYLLEKTSLAEKFSMKRKSRILFLFFNELWLNRFKRIKNSEEVLFLNRRNSFKTSLLCHVDLVTPERKEFVMTIERRTTYMNKAMP